MISKEDFVKIETMAALGIYQKDIASELGISEKTVHRALKRGSAPKVAMRARGQKLEPYKAKVDELLARGVWNGQVILREIQAQGYRGGRTVLREYMKPKRLMRAKQNRATVRYETEPGKQMQTDWGQMPIEIGGETIVVHFQVNTLGYSRRFHFWCTDSEDAEHTYEGHVRSFEYFGGVTDEVLLDNQKVAVIKHTTRDGAVFQERYLDFASYCGFKPKACRPYRARTKGKDERMVGYVKGNFFVRYPKFDSWTHLHQLSEQWLREEADQRLHGTVKEIVAVRFEREKDRLKALPAMRYDTAYHELRQVSWDAYVEVRGNRYSVPSDYAGCGVRVHISLGGQLKVFTQQGASIPIAEHRLVQANAGWVTQADHHTALWQRTLGDSMLVERRSLAAYQAVAE